MWKRIHSNRDPRDTLYSELRKEFSGYFDRFGRCLSSVVQAYPKFIFGLMVFLLLVSAISVPLLLRRPRATVPAQKNVPNVVTDGFSEIMRTTAGIRETLGLKHLVDSISAKKQLSPADSVLLDSALTRLQHIHSQIKN